MYPREAHMFTSSSLRSKFHRIVRMSIKKLYSYIAEYGNSSLPELARLDDIKMKVIIHNKVGKKARNALLTFYAS